MAFLINATTVVDSSTDGSFRVIQISSGTLGNYGSFNSTNANGGYVTFLRSGTVHGDIGTAAQVVSGGSVNDFAINARGSRNLIFGTDNTERMRITSGGNVGIGTTSPTFRLDLIGASGVGMQIYETSTGNNNRIIITQVGTVTTYNSTYSSGTGAHAWQIGNSEKARITTDGELIIGQTTTPLPGDGQFFNSTGRWTTRQGSGAIYALFNNSSGTEIGSIRNSGNSTTTFNTSSDRRLKSNIVPAHDAGAVIDAIEIVQHDWKEGGSVRYGVVAQDLHQVAPEVVAVGDDGEEIEKTWGVDYSKLVPMLIKEVQSLRKRVAELEAK